jgi:hypothetical protein
MSSPTNLAYDVLWFGHPVLQAAVATAMLRRKLHNRFPVFFSYVIAQLVIFGVTYPIYRSGNYDAFFYVYWIGSAVSVLLGFKVIHEIFLDVFRPYHTLKDLGTVLFRWAGLVMLLVAIIVAISSPSAQQSPLIQATLTTQRCVRMIQCGLILFLLVFSRYLGISWRQHSFGISLGLGGFASVEMALVAARAGGLVTQMNLDMVNMGAYNAAILVWFAYFLRTSPAREASTTLLQSHRWERSLTDITRPATPDSLIPLFENMVDRALSRTNGAPPPLAEEEPPRPTKARAIAAGYGSRELPSKT